MVGEASIFLPKQRMVALRVGNLTRPQLSIERHEPQPMLALLAEYSYDDLPAIRRDVVSVMGHSHGGKAWEEGFIAPGIEVHHAQFGRIRRRQRAS
jgi:hypothetical protein